MNEKHKIIVWHAILNTIGSNKDCLVVHKKKCIIVSKRYSATTLDPLLD
jgi:hypothetical protein